MSVWNTARELSSFNLGSVDPDSLSYDELLDMKDFIDGREAFFKYNKLTTFKPDDWLFRLNKKMETEGVGSIIASNRSGKSYSTTWLYAVHLTGLYPDDWDGLRYEQGIDTWVMSPTSENYAQAGGLQEYLLGSLDDIGTGWIPKENILKVESGIGTKGFIKKVYVQHASGSISTVEYKSYSQGQHVLMGGNIDLIVIDEEPKDKTIIGQCTTRISQAKSGKGRVLLCFTPENGMTEVVSSCFEGQWKDGCERVTVYDVSFITPEKIEEMKRNMPEREHNMRLLGIPSIGAGAVYPQTEDELKFFPEQVEIKPHWKVAGAIDFGYNPDPCCILFGAVDPDTDILYIFKEFYETQQTTTQVAGWLRTQAPRLPIIYPADANTIRVNGDKATTYRDQYSAENINMAVRVDYKGGREEGHSLIRERMRYGKFYVSNDCVNWWKEFRVYQYNDKSSTTHCVDHAMDATRYLVQKIHEVGIEWKDAQNAQYVRSRPKSVGRNRFNK